MLTMISFCHLRRSKDESNLPDCLYFQFSILCLDNFNSNELFTGLHTDFSQYLSLASASFSIFKAKLLSKQIKCHYLVFIISYTELIHFLESIQNDVLHFFVSSVFFGLDGFFFEASETKLKPLQHSILILFFLFFLVHIFTIFKLLKLNPFYFFF